MSTSDSLRFVDDPKASVSGQFPLCRPDVAAPPPHMGCARPWGLRELTLTRDSRSVVPELRYDHDLQLAVVDGAGTPLVYVVAAAPTAPTTTRTDGEDGPSSEDWKNDFAPDEPCPF